MNVIKFPIRRRESDTDRYIDLKKAAVRTFLRDLKNEGAVAVAAVLVMPDGTMHAACINCERDMVEAIQQANVELVALIENHTRIA